MSLYPPPQGGLHCQRFYFLSVGNDGEFRDSQVKCERGYRMHPLVLGRVNRIGATKGVATYRETSMVQEGHLDVGSRVKETNT